MYAAFNARDIDVLLEPMTPDVDWPSAWEGGRVHGHGRTLKATGSTLGSITDGTVAVEVDQVVRGSDGAVLAEGRVVHV